MSTTDQQQDESEKRGDGPFRNPVREMFFLALLYLPLGFFLWFFAASLLMFPTRLALQTLLGALHGEVFEKIFQAGFTFEIQTGIVVDHQQSGQKMALTWDVNPMIYAWGMALLFGLIMATPLSVWRRLFQLAMGFVLVSVVTVWATYWEIWRDLAFQFSQQFQAPVAAVVADSGLSATAIALCYQLGYLMFPGVIPIAAWILMNRPFIEKLVQSRRR